MPGVDKYVPHFIGGDGPWELFWRDAEGNDCREVGDMQYIASEYTQYSLIYRYVIIDEIDGTSKVCHEHSFNDVLCALLHNTGQFAIPDKYLFDYSKQEIELLERFLLKLLDED